VLQDYPIAELRDYIDWSPFFATWELTGKFPRDLDDAKYGEAARSLFADAQAMLDRIASERWFRASAVFGFWPANSEGDDILVYGDEQANQADCRAAHAAPATSPGAKGAPTWRCAI
jgi:5-methyltetrahydrofolate--homocysteine methyltransferase